MKWRKTPELYNTNEVSSQLRYAASLPEPCHLPATFLPQPCYFPVIVPQYP